MTLLQQLLSALQGRITAQPVQTALAASVLLLLAYVAANEVVRHRARVPGMRGPPPGLPLVGNLWAVRSGAAARYREWAGTYGPVYQVQMGNVPVVVVNSAAAARRLWAGQGQALSSRPVTYTFHKVSCCRRMLGRGGGGGRLHIFSSDHVPVWFTPG